MGCCVSTVESSKHHPDGPKNRHLHPRSAAQKSNAALEVESRSPPAAEEETVKEVLSETPISKSQVPFLPAETKAQMPNIQPQDGKLRFNDLEEVFSRTQVPFSLEESKIGMPVSRPPPEKFESKEEVSEVSQLSEMCSVTESFSTATTATIGEKREEEATSKRSSREATSQRSIRSPSSNAPRKRPFTVDSNSARERRSKSPARRAEPSPEKRSQGNSRTVRGRESGQAITRKPSLGSAGVLRDAGERSGRRSRSPSTRLNQSRVNTGGRSQVKAPGGTGRQLPQAAKAVENENKGSEKIKEGNDGVPRESLENPHGLQSRDGEKADGKLEVLFSFIGMGQDKETFVFSVSPTIVFFPWGYNVQNKPPLLGPELGRIFSCQQNCPSPNSPLPIGR
ncbi:CLK4-associating serine/arginine rich protein [Neltuma alba]|uniref:CLK4-associating serine/arginine rich protein n=1 Tax=Neltuma alba TaxID=207710 RepID=UPI0010A30A70|nr:CLK4-associating serine/arginine rich protein-like [Prosopis alba]